MPNKLVSESIDERILRLLGLEDVFDLDYDTYMTLLKEAMVKGSFGNSKIPDEELAILANERKRVRGKTGRFKTKKQKITADKISTTKLLKPSKKSLDLSTISTDTSKKDFSGILGPLESISKTLSSIFKFNKKSDEQDRKENERNKRSKREEGLEGFKRGVSAISNAAKKMLAPFQNIIDRIWRFIFFTLLGRAFTQLMSWLGDPKNKRKIEVLGRFLKDWWPSLAFAAGLFLTPFGKFVRTTIGAVRAFIPQLLALTTNPAFLALAGATAGGVAGASLESNLKKVDETLLQRKIKEAKDKGKPLSKQEIEKIKLEQLQKRVQDIRGTNIPGSALLGASGGLVPRFSMGGINFGTGYDGIDGNTGQKVSGFGPDTQAIIAQPGEIVINKKTVDAVGADHFLTLNRQYGGPGANKPKMGRLYNTGGIVGRGLNFLGGLGLPGTGSVMAPNYTGMGYQNKFLGMNLNRVNLPQIPGRQFSQSEVQRYNQSPVAPSTIRDWSPFDPVQVSVPKSKSTSGSSVGGAFRNFGRNIQTIKGTASRQEAMMRQMGHRPSGYTNLLGQPIKRQGGGMIPQGPFTPLPSPGYVRPQGSFIPKPILRLPGPMPGTTLPFGYNPFSGLRGGGMVKSTTGLDVSGTADTQLAALQPGEFVITKGAVDKFGINFLEKINSVDYDSNAAKKLGKTTINKPRITPLPRAGTSAMMTLPPITQSAATSPSLSQASTSQVPSFSAMSSSGMEERSMNASIYGIVG